MRTSEWILCGYFAYLVVVAGVLLPGRHIRRVLLISLVCTGLIVMLSRLRPSPILRLGRDWLPVMYFLQAYWLSGLYYRRPARQVEQWLMRLDRWLFARARIPSFLERAPRALLEYLELTYLSCAAFVPTDLAVLYLAGQRFQADRYWTCVAVALLACYGTLPWIQTRPPRSLEGTTEIDRRGLVFRRLNLLTLAHGSIQVNTFPSGHAAGSLAIALIVAEIHPLIGGICLAWALGIAVASVVGRYHYAADAMLGILLPFAAWGLTRFM